jgi:hypothetical protein
MKNTTLLQSFLSLFLSSSKQNILWCFLLRNIDQKSSTLNPTYVSKINQYSWRRFFLIQVIYFLIAGSTFFYTYILHHHDYVAQAIYEAFLDRMRMKKKYPKTRYVEWLHKLRPLLSVGTAIN